MIASKYANRVRECLWIKYANLLSTCMCDVRYEHATCSNTLLLLPIPTFTHSLADPHTLPEALVEEVDVVPRLVEQAAPTGEVLQVSGLTHLLKHRVGEGLLGRHEHLG